ncbi:hypothetical protein QJS10_CPA05g00084 [Acorus calamus]|uniref:F-box domain-containing protein n=1 Tax=Acorus calamus TaxID=4465 RepID=A0AAV9EXC9_ACOCL|nr:hypothetical protein QJS10_CPA05g00084 [Acorus calamus]
MGQKKFKRRRLNNRTKPSISADHVRPWSDLPEPAIDAISSRLGPVDRINLSCVCSSWRSAGKASRSDPTNHPPLLLHRPSKSGKTCTFADLPNKVSYKTSLSALYNKRCFGCSHGYLFVSNGYSPKPLLFNPFTRERFFFPKTPLRIGLCVMTSNPKSPGCTIVTFGHSASRVFQYCKVGDELWSIRRFGLAGKWPVWSAVAFEGKIYVLTKRGTVATVDIDAQPKMAILDVDGVVGDQFEFRATYPYRPFLAECDGDLLMVYFDHRRLIVYKMDFLVPEWMRIPSLGDWSLFVSPSGSVFSVVTPSRWGFRADSVYFAGVGKNMLGVYSLDNNVYEVIMVGAADADGDLADDLMTWISPSLY